MASHSPDAHPDRLTRTVTASIGWVTRHPWLVVAVCLALAVQSVRVSSNRLEYHTQRNDLLSAEKECQKRWQKYLDQRAKKTDPVFEPWHALARLSDKEFADAGPSLLNKMLANPPAKLWMIV